MQSINFKSRLEREREMIRRKIHSSNLYRKPSFSKASTTFNIYNTNSEAGKMSMATRNMKLNELKEEIKRVSAVLNDDENQDDEDKSMLCIGNKYLNSSLLSAPSITTKSASTSNLELISGEITATTNSKLLVEAADFEKAISQSHLSPSASFTNFSNHSNKKLLSAIEVETPQEVTSDMLKGEHIISNDKDAGDENRDIRESPARTLNINTKRKDHSKFSKKSTLKVLSAVVGVNLYDDDNTTVDLDETTTDKHASPLHHHPASSKKSTKKHGGTASRKKSSSHNSHRKSGVKHSSSSSPKKSPAAIRKASQELS